MADILYYPHDYLPLPLMDGYGFKHISPLLRTEMTSGRAASVGGICPHPQTTP
jgi:hypothetical protein